MVSKPPVALITGITGQDGAYLARFLLDKGYEVHGIKRRASLINSARVDAIYEDPHVDNKRFIMHHGDMTDATSLIRILQQTQATEIYNLAAQSHVAVSFEMPEYTANSDALGTLRLLEAIRILNMQDRTRFYQASTSEMYGNSPAPQNETTPFAPRSPYAAAKLYAYWITVNYREAYGIHASNGILFNHESPMRGETFVTRKITRGVAQLVTNDRALPIYLGNLDAQRDWGHARDFVRGMWQMLQQEKPDDYVLATGKMRSVREFVNAAFAAADIQLEWRGSDENETAHCKKTNRACIKIDPRYYRPTEVDALQGDAAKAKKTFGWQPEFSFDQMVMEMVSHDIMAARRYGQHITEYDEI
ncbi:MAG TPA: GDP-mannose 4,6-dehydratase [Alphaproteobacteria bacterium]|nr:GDP-mannose 4,6-dehydratase [Alphaproteobacteria bacterium]